MSALRPGSMRVWREATHVLLLLLLLVLTGLTGTALCQSEYDNVEEAIETHDEAPSDDESTGDGDTPTSETPLADSGATTTTELGPISGEDEHGSTDETPYSTTGQNGDDVDVDSSSPPETEDVSPIIILIPVVLVVLIIGMIVGGILIHRRCIKKVTHADHTKEDLYLDGSSTEKVPMPMFEDDVPSVLELEMEELDQWMNKDG